MSGTLIKKVCQVLAVILFVLAFSTISSNHPTEGILGDIFNLFAIMAAMTGVAPIAAWWKHREDNKKLFDWRVIIFLSLLSVIGLSVTIFSQAVNIARQKADATAQPAQWQEYTAADGSFAIRFPTTPTHMSSEGTNGDIHFTTDNYISAPNTKSR